MKYTFEFFFIERSRDAVCSTYIMAAQTLTVRWLFCQLRKWPPARMPGRVYRPVRPLVLIYNSITGNIHSLSHGEVLELRILLDFMNPMKLSDMCKVINFKRLTPSFFNTA